MLPTIFTCTWCHALNDTSLYCCKCGSFCFPLSKREVLFVQRVGAGKKITNLVMKRKNGKIHLYEIPEFPKRELDSTAEVPEKSEITPKKRKRSFCAFA